MRKVILPLFLTALVCLCTWIFVTQAWASVTYTITNGSTFEPVVPISKAESAVVFYDYVTPGGSHGNPDFGTESNTGFIWLYEDTNTGNISLGMIFDTLNDSGGGTVDMNFAGVPGTGFIEVADDAPGTHVTDDDFTTTKGHWLWNACCGDGGVIGGLDGSWEIVLNLLSSTGIKQWYFLNGTGDPANPGRIELDMTQLLTISAISEPPPDISGCIKYKGEPLTNTKVILQQKRGKKLTTVTDSNGYYEFKEVTVDSSKLKLRIFSHGKDENDDDEDDEDDEDE